MFFLRAIRRVGRLFPDPIYLYNVRKSHSESPWKESGARESFGLLSRIPLPIISSRQRAPQMGTSIGRTVLIHAPIFSPHHAKGENRRRPFLIGLETQAALGQYSLPPIVRLMSFPLSTSRPAALSMGSSKWGPSASGRAKKSLVAGLRQFTGGASLFRLFFV